jgi:hypothetical protein
MRRELKQPYVYDNALDTVAYATGRFQKIWQEKWVTQIAPGPRRPSIRPLGGVCGGALFLYKGTLFNGLAL